MSLKRNVIASYASQIYVTLIGILMLPMYIKYMGAEAYGLVGFFAMLQAWFNLLDLGLTPTIGRETARFRAGAVDVLSFRRLFRALSAIFFIVAILGGGGLLMLSSVIASDWLNVESLALNEVHIALQIMAVSVALRWVCGLYRGVVTGSELLVWLGGFNAIIASLRFVGVFPVMWNFGFTPTVFFCYQLLVAIIEFAGLWFKSKRLLPSLPLMDTYIGWSLAPLKPVLKFSLTIAFTASVWVMVTQVDKLILSNILSLQEYGYFVLAVLVASSILMVGGPVSGALMPRMAKLEAEGKRDEVIRIYRQATQLVTVIAGSVAVTLAFCAEPLLWAWTGDAALSGKTAPILILYAVGNGILSVAAFPYYLQYAKGDLRLHFVGHILLLFTLIPSIVLASTYYGAIGAGYAWVVVNSLYLLVWVAVVHGKIVPGLHLSWFGKDVAVIGLPVVALGGGISFLGIDVVTRPESLLYVIFFGLSVIVFGSFFSSSMRNIFRKIGCKTGADAT